MKTKNNGKKFILDETQRIHKVHIKKLMKLHLFIFHRAFLARMDPQAHKDLLAQW